MKKRVMANKRKGFTMVELIFVVIFLGILAAIAIPKITGSTESATLASMKNDARTNITAENTYYIQYQEYADVSVDGADDGAAVPLGDTEIKAVASPYNTVLITPKDCEDGTKGYTLQITSTKTDKMIDYDSCTDASIRVTTP